jgi:molybdenum cofactor cytidylyltransferase
VLAAGTSTRFGSTKQLHQIEGRTLVQHAIDALVAGGVGEVIVVTGHDAEPVEAKIVLPPAGRFVRNPDFRSGQASSLAAALHEVAPDSEGAVILMGDQPGVSAADVIALIAGFSQSRSKIVRASYSDGPGPALLSREIYAEAGHLHGDVGARVLIASHPDWVHEVKIDAPVPRDIDTPQDLLS